MIFNINGKDFDFDDNKFIIKEENYNNYNKYVQDLIDRNKPKKPKKITKKEYDSFEIYPKNWNIFLLGYCPICKSKIQENKHNFCNRCGQKLDWNIDKKDIPFHN